MNWDDVDAFCHVIEHGGFSAAARAMNRPKSSVSVAIARLETHINVRLLQRTTRRVSPTEAGISLYHDVGPTFKRLREVEVDAMGLGQVVAGTLRIAAPYEFGAHHAGAVACAMLAQYPRLRIDIEVEHARIDPLDRRYDIVFSMADDDMSGVRAIARRVFSLPRGIYAAPGLLARHAPLRGPQDLQAMPMLASLHESHWSFGLAGGATASVAIAPRMRSSNADVRRQAAIAGLGVARLTSSFCQEAVRAGRLAAVLPEYPCSPLRLYTLLPGRRLMPLKVKLFLDAIEAGAAP